MPVLLDTNILLYACLEQDVEKMRIAEDVLRHTDCHISAQLLNEMTNTLRRKMKLSLDDIGKLIADIRSLTTAHNLTTSIYARGE